MTFGLPAMPASTQGMPGGIGEAMGAPMPPVQGFEDGGLVEAMKRYNTRLSGLGDDRDRARAMALLAASGAILGGGSSNTLKNVGAGIGAFAGSYGDQLKNIDSQEIDLLRGINDIGQAQNLMDIAQLEQALKSSGGSGETFYAPVPGRVGDKPAYVQFGNQGTVRPLEVPEGFTPQSRFEKIDAGDSWIIKDLITGQTEIVPKQGAPGTNMNVEGVGPERTMAPAPGSADDLARQADARAAEIAASRKETTANIVTQDIDRAIELVNTDPLLTTGFGATVTSNLGFGPASDLKRLLSPIKAALSFDKLQEIRESSPTGGGLGPVSNYEITLLGNAYGAIDPDGMKQEDLIFNLNRLKELYERVITTGIKDPNSPDNPSASPASAPAAGASPAAGTTTTDIPWSR
jgi:hypothetical protein